MLCHIRKSNFKVNKSQCVMEKECRAGSSFTQQKCWCFWVLVAQAWLTLAANIITWTVKDEEAWTHWRRAVCKHSQILCWDLSWGWGTLVLRAVEPLSQHWSVGAWHLHLRGFGLKPPQLRSSWELLLVRHSGLEFQIFSQHLSVRFLSLVNTVTFCFCCSQTCRPALPWYSKKEVKYSLLNM